MILTEILLCVASAAIAAGLTVAVAEQLMDCDDEGGAA